jgi:hypothetical protein
VCWRRWIPEPNEVVGGLSIWLSVDYGGAWSAGILLAAVECCYVFDMVRQAMAAVPEDRRRDPGEGVLDRAGQRLDLTPLAREMPGFVVRRLGYRFALAGGELLTSAC